MNETLFTSDQIDELVQAVFAKVEKHHGKTFTAAVRRLLIDFITLVLVESTRSGLRPGQLISAFITVTREIDKISDEVVLGSGDLHRN